MSQIPQDFSRSLLIAEYWTRDLGLETAQIVRALSANARFKKAQEGWFYHVQSELAIPPEAGVCNFPRSVKPEQLACVCLLACALTGVPIYAVIASSGSSSLCKGMAMLAEEMLCPFPTAAQALGEVMHPGLTDLVRCLSSRLTMQHGRDHTEACLNRHMSQTLTVQTEEDHLELLRAARLCALEFSLSNQLGMVSLPCKIFLTCTFTDHALLFFALLHTNSHLAKPLQDDLNLNTGAYRKLFWSQMDAASCRKS